MTITIKDLGDAIIYIGAIAVAMAAIGVIVRLVVLQPLKTWITREIQRPLDRVESEVTPNHGSSLRDAVDRVETAQQHLAKRLDDHLNNHAGGNPK